MVIMLRQNPLALYPRSEKLLLKTQLDMRATLLKWFLLLALQDPIIRKTFRVKCSAFSQTKFETRVSSIVTSLYFANPFSLKDTPTCHDLALFIRYISGKVKGQSDDGATQHEYVPVGLSLFRKNLRFRYKDLIINQHEAIRIEFSFVDLLEKEYSLDILATATTGLLVKSLAS
ncbi:uncharacterized protein FMAN_01444 [Fusarium mangiferae]|uniref:Uncharacterized protein n=1 Tax=Fusarium mangiferae TaxID=192010 RepID=A0A1L7SN87_FUSMA|nr:uncharacterized protein FMAN_01444 [Fusarium mangiferae]CVK84388.1 uncharacterized protein FMAN_01444 [Fusarium mangiferae]